MLGDPSLSPMTNEMGLIKGGVREVVSDFVAWQKAILPKEVPTVRQLKTDARSAVLRLLPLTAPVPTRAVFIEAQSKWVAYFDNGCTGTDAAGVCAVLAKRVQTTSIRAVVSCLPGREATIVELHEKDTKHKRTVFAGRDGARWQFGQSGQPLGVEDRRSFAASRIRDRFTPEHLDVFLRHFGVRAFDPKWFHSRAILVERHPPFPVEQFSREV